MSDHAPPPSAPPANAPNAKGPLAWMARNSVAANLLMFGLLIGGLLFSRMVKQEVFPQFALDIVNVQVVYPGASPEEVERAITKVVEENVRGIDGVKKVTSTSAEGVATITCELLLGADADRALSDIKGAVDRIASFPADAERPIVSVVALRNEVLSLVLYGDADEASIRALAEETRERLLESDEITTVELAGVRTPEISVEVPREKLRAYNLTLDQVAAAIRRANVEIPAGGIKTQRGEILLRTSERRDFGHEFENIELLARPDGTVVHLSDVARVVDGFQDSDLEARFNGKTAAMVRIYRVGEQTPIAVADAVHQYMKDHQADLPAGVKFAVWNDRSQMYRERIDLLMRNAYLGLALVMLSLGLFLEIRLAFWVTLGIPISFLGTLIFLPVADVSINMISLFAFIVTLGIVVDDAIVVGEAVHKRRSEGLSPAMAAVMGLKDVATPVVFSVLTTVLMFSPLLFVPGIMGKFFRNIPAVVITVLLLSLVESLLVLPAHLGHENPVAKIIRRVGVAIFGPRLGPFGAIVRAQQRFSAAYERFIENVFVPILRVVVRNRFITVATCVGLFVAAVGYVKSGRIEFTFMPKIEGDVAFAQLSMPYGTPVAESRRHMQRIIEAAQEVVREQGPGAKVAKGIYAQVGAANFGGMGRGFGGAKGGHVSEVAVLLEPAGTRVLSAKEMTQAWRALIGDIPGADSLKFKYTTGASASAPISVELAHSKVDVLEKAAAELAQALRGFSGVKDIDDGVALGKVQLNFELKPEGRALGITETDLARQVRASFFGAEASRQQRGRDEVRVYARLPQNERSSLYDLEQLMIRTPQGGEVPLAQAATVGWGRAYTSIKRIDGRRVITVEADVEIGKANANKVVAELEKGALADLVKKYPGLTFDYAGMQADQAESLKSLGVGFMLALIAMFALMAIPLKSYAQPLLIMLAIPFGFVGAVGGHVMMGFDLSILSMMGVVALSGVVVNDSLVLIAAVNDYRAAGMTPFEAIIAAGGRRFRPIMLTSITTFLGLVPMIAETSMQARFLVPMAISLGFGVLFTTFIILLMVPSVYMILESAKARLADMFDEDDAVAPAAAE